MTTQYTSILKLALPVQGELSGTWGDVVNDNITSMIEEAIAGRSVINTWTANAHTLTTADGTTSESRAAMLEFTDTGAALSGNAEVICPTASKIYIAKNAVGSSRTVTLKTSAGTGIAIPDGTTMLLFCDGTNVVEAVTNINSLSVGGYTVTLAGAVSTAAAFSTAGANALTLTTTGTTNVTLPTTGTLATLAGTETFTNKTLTSPDINGGSVDNATIGATTPSTGVFTNLTANTDLTLATGATVTGINTTTDMSDASTTTLATSDSIKQYVDAQVGANNELSEVLANGNTTGANNIVVTAGQSITTDSILETTAAAGVDIDGILLKDTSVGTDDASGTDISGTNVTLRGGAGTGTGAGGSLIFQTAPAGTTGSTVNTQVTALTIDSAGDISFYEDTGTTAKLFWDASAESLGIGTASPNTILHVSSSVTTKSVVETTGAASDALIEFTKGQGSGNTWSMGIDHSNSSAFSLAYLSNGSPSLTTNGVLTVDTSGNLLVATTNDTPGLGDTDVGASFRADGASFVSRTLSDTSGSTLYVNRNTNDGNLVQFQKDGTIVGSIGTIGGDLTVSSSATDHSGLRFALNNILPMKNGAIVDAAIDLGQTSGTNYRFKDLYLSGGLRGDTTFSNNAGTTEYARFDSSGKLLVGCTSQPDASNFGGSINPIGQFRSSRNSTSSATQFSFNNPNGEVGTIVTSGTATAYNTSSDQRLKENIVDAPSASDDIDAIQVRSFDWKADGSHQKYGMVAQELVTVAPEAVSQPEDPEEMMGVDYSKLVPMMLKEIQSLRARVAQLEGTN